MNIATQNAHVEIDMPRGALRVRCEHARGASRGAPVDHAVQLRRPSRVGDRWHIVTDATLDETRTTYTEREGDDLAVHAEFEAFIPVKGNVEVAGVTIESKSDHARHARYEKLAPE